MHCNKDKRSRSNKHKENFTTESFVYKGLYLFMKIITMVAVNKMYSKACFMIIFFEFIC